MKITKIVASGLLMSCVPGPGDVSGPPPDNHEQIVLESIPYEALGTTRVTFRRDDGEKRAFISLDGASRTGVIAASVFGSTWLAESPTSRTLVYEGDAARDNHQRVFDIYVRDWAATTGSALGGPGGARGTPSWSPDGSRVLFGESTTSSLAFTFDRIVTQSPVPGALDRRVIWAASQAGEVAWQAVESVTKDLVFLYSYPLGPGDPLDSPGVPRIARAAPGGVAQILYTPPDLHVYVPTWSPTGAEIAFLEVASFDPAGFANVRLRRMAGDGSNVRTIAMLRGYGNPGPLSASMCWPGDGSRIVFSFFDGADASHVFVANVADGNVTQITSAANTIDFSVSCK